MLGEWMEREIREQPEILHRQAEQYFETAHRAIGGTSFDMVVIAARGSSDHAAQFGRYLLEINLGIPVSLAAPSVLTRYGTKIKYKNALAIGISQSGSAPDVSEVLGMMREEGHSTLAITNTPGSRLTTESESCVLLGCGPEKSVAATKTYSASLLALYQITRALGATLEDPTSFLPTSDWVDRTQQAGLEASGPLLRSRPTFALARGYSFCTALETALKLMECALVPCKAYSTADFEHGPKALAGSGSAAIVYGEPASGIAEQGCRILSAPESPVSPMLKPIWDIFFGQWLALSAARAHGLNPDRPEHIKKVTETL
ncbi:MAG TPA: SIS domain-containing protein [Fimbriimonadaceae bacterium]|nr:SIS domain-containing protein [Fimbriimonadaceae bacterium]